MSNHGDSVGIICLRHKCDSLKVRITWAQEQTLNSKCNKCLDQDASEPMIEVAVLNYPFSNSSQLTYDLALIPSRGTFLDEFNNTSGLHIGIVNGNGDILEFDRSGVKLNQPSREKWRQCLALNFLNGFLQNKSCDIEKIHSMWDDTVEELSKSKSNIIYQETHNNCFDFVLLFVHTLTKRFKKDSMQNNISLTEMDNLDKVKFCEKFVVPVTKIALRYIICNNRLNSAKENWMDGTISG